MYYVIVNPASRSGRGAKIWSMLEPALNRKKISYKAFISREAGHVTRLVRELSSSLLMSDPEITIRLIVLGGDGTLNEVLQGITDFARVQIGYIPTGSSNDLARDLALPADPLENLERVLSCREPSFMDLGCLTYEQMSGQYSRQHAGPLQRRRYFCVSCGIGFDAAVCEEALSSKFKNILNKIGLGKLIYLTIALRQLIMARKISCSITLACGQVIELPGFLFVTGMIHQYEGGGFKFCPGANSGDGLLDLCAVGSIPKWLILLALPTAFSGKHYRFKGIDRYSTMRARIKTSAPLWVHTDGEVTMKSDCIVMTCEKRKLQLLL